MRIPPLFIVGLMFLLFAIVGGWLRPYDDTDDAKNGGRSGMALYTETSPGASI